MQKPIYLDYAATTPVDPRVAERMSACLTQEGIFGNPASRSHFYGWQAEEAVENARLQVAELLGCDAREVVWTSGATESNNLAIKGVARSRKSSGKHIITSQVEHKAVLDTCKALESEGFELTYLQPNSNGSISPDQLAEALREDTILVSLMHVNNEVGALNKLSEIGRICRIKNIAFHSDGAQAAGKLPLNMADLNVDLYSISAHKMYGPKGIGALYVRRCAEIQLQPIIHGGGHERGMRSGTLATHQIVGLGEAAALCSSIGIAEQERIEALRNTFWQGIQHLEGVRLNGSLEGRIANNLNVSFGNVDGEMLLIALRNIAVSTGSACTSATVEPSYVLTAMGLSPAHAHSSIRFSFGRFTTPEEIENAIHAVCKAHAELCSASGSRAAGI